MEKKLFGELENQKVYVYTLSDKNFEVDICTLGGTIMAIRTPDRDGNIKDVTLGYTGVDGIMTKGGCLGATIGRFGNRIKNGRFTLNGKEYQLAVNNGNNHLHGGTRGFNKRIFADEYRDGSLYLTYVSADGEENYPGELTLTVKFTVKDCTLTIEYFAKCDKDTIFNPTNHSYFNLNGESDGSILDNVLRINAEKFAVIDDMIPTGELRDVKGTPFDFTDFKPIGMDIDKDYEQLFAGKGYDHNFVIADSHFATAYSDKTGIQMDCYTDMPGVQFYSGNFLNCDAGKSYYGRWSGFALETQYFPDSINHPEFLSPILRAGKDFYSCTKYAFSVRK